MSEDTIKGLFITLEGGEGSGKTTLIDQLSLFLKERGQQVVKTREPGGTALAETIRQWLLTRDKNIAIGTQAELLLFLAARAQHIEEFILPALKEGKIVLCDRFNDSTVAYQGLARSLDLSYVKKLCQMVCGEVQPQLTLFLNVDPQVGLDRSKALSKDTSATGELDRIESEKLAFHEKVRQAFIEIAHLDPYRVKTIDANIPQEEVFKQAIKYLEPLINHD